MILYTDLPLIRERFGITNSRIAQCPLPDPKHPKVQVGSGYYISTKQKYIIVKEFECVQESPATDLQGFDEGIIERDNIVTVKPCRINGHP